MEALEAEETALFEQLRRRRTISIFGFTVRSRAEEQLAILTRLDALYEELWRLREAQMAALWRAALREAACGGGGGGAQQAARQAQLHSSELVLREPLLLDDLPAPHGAAASWAPLRTAMTRPGVAFCLAGCAVACAACCFLLLRPKEL